MTLSVWAAPDSGKQAELKDLRTRIQALQDEIEKNSEDKSEITDALKNSERRISDINRGLHRLESKRQELSQTLDQLEKETRATQSQISEQQSMLAALLREQYVQRGNDALKLMLNGKNPDEAARNVEYYGYVGRARAELIRHHRESLNQLQLLQAKTHEQTSNLQKIKKERVAQKQTLEAEKGSRQQVLYKLSAQIHQQRKEIDTLVRDEKRLTRLIEKLAKLAVTKPKPQQKSSKPGQKVDVVADASLAGLNFPKLKGKLALPVAGEILNKFGQYRDDGGPAWKGLFIRARQGREVHSVGSGKVAFSDWLRGFGNLLIIDHGSGYLSLYSNNESLYKQPGDSVAAGDVIATVGSTGGQDEPGLYFELRHQGKPFDPLSWVRSH